MLSRLLAHVVIAVVMGTGSATLAFAPLAPTQQPAGFTASSLGFPRANEIPSQWRSSTD